ncbi:hypothetical protein Tco_0483638 [Tanacetum coccineum]
MKNQLKTSFGMLEMYRSQSPRGIKETRMDKVQSTRKVDFCDSIPKLAPLVVVLIGVHAHCKYHQGKGWQATTGMNTGFIDSGCSRHMTGA